MTKRFCDACGKDMSNYDSLVYRDDVSLKDRNTAGTLEIYIKYDFKGRVGLTDVSFCTKCLKKFIRQGKKKND
jgi:hypothetical protein